MGSLWHQDTGPTQNLKQESRKSMDSDPYCITNMDPKARKHTSVQCCGSGPFSRIRIRSNFPNPTIKSHITRSKSNKLNRYFWEKFTFFK